MAKRINGWHGQTLALLENRPAHVTLADVARRARVGLPWLKKLARRAGNEPGADKLYRVYRVLWSLATERELERQAIARAEAECGAHQLERLTEPAPTAIRAPDGIRPKPRRPK